MSHNLENNKIISAILVAGIVACLAGFVAKKVVHIETPEKSVLEIDTSALEAAAGGEAAPTGPEPILALLATADATKGEALAKACLACHDFSKGGPNKTGPNLYGIVNNKKAHKDDFAYSDVIKEMSAKGDHWTYQNLGAFLWKPAAYAKGTKMSFPGLKKPQDRANVIAYLRTLADSPAPLPSAAEIAAEAPKADAKGTTAGTAAPTNAKKQNEATGEKSSGNEGKTSDALKPDAATTPAKNAAPSAETTTPEKSETKKQVPGEADEPKSPAPKNTEGKTKPADAETDKNAPDVGTKSDAK